MFNNKFIGGVMKKYFKIKTTEFTISIILIISTIPSFPQQVQSRKEDYKQSMMEKYSFQLNNY